MVVAVDPFPAVVLSFQLLCLVVGVGCHFCINPAFAWSFLAVASWLLWSLCLVVVVHCLSWLMFPAIVSSFPMVASWLLHCCVLQLCLVVLVATIVMDAFVAVVLIIVGCCG